MKLTLLATLLLSSCAGPHSAEYHEARLAARLLSLSPGPPEGKAKANRRWIVVSHTIYF